MLEGPGSPPLFSASRDLFFDDSDSIFSLEIVKFLSRLHILSQNILVHIPRQHLTIVIRMFSRRDREDLIQFLEGVGLRLRETEVGEYPTE